MMYWGTGWTWGNAIPMMIGMVAIWTLIVVGVVVAVRRFDRPAPKERSPEQILAERFAAGEIDEVEYHSRVAVLRGEMIYAR